MKIISFAWVRKSEIKPSTESCVFFTNNIPAKWDSDHFVCVPFQQLVARMKMDLLIFFSKSFCPSWIHGICTPVKEPNPNCPQKYYILTLGPKLGRESYILAICMQPECSEWEEILASHIPQGWRFGKHLLHNCSELGLSEGGTSFICTYFLLFLPSHTHLPPSQHPWREVFRICGDYLGKPSLPVDTMTYANLGGKSESCFVLDCRFQLWKQKNVLSWSHHWPHTHFTGVRLFTLIRHVWGKGM